MTWAIETFSLSKYFPPVESGQRSVVKSGQSQIAVNGVSLAIKPGELFGLLGPNGAGKTTLIKMLATLILPSSGTALVNGYDLAADEAVRNSVNLVSGDGRSLYWRLTGRQNLEFFAALYHLPSASLSLKIKEVLGLVGLEEAAEVPVRAYSSGMKQRLAIARALLKKTPILLLDEPTRGLDPAATRQFHRILREELTSRQGFTVVIATNQLWEAEVLCQRVAVLHQGRLQRCGSPTELRRDLGLTGRWQLVIHNLTPSLKKGLEECPLPLRLSSLGNGQFLVEWDAAEEGIIDDVVQIVSRGGGKIITVSQEQASLEDIFTTLTQQRSHSGVSQGQEFRENPIRTARPHSSMVTKIKQTVTALKSWPQVAAAFLKRDLLEEWSYRLSFFLRFLSIFFSVAMFYFLSRLFGQSVNPFLKPYGADYFSFVIVGLGFSQYFDVGLSTFSHNLRESQTTGTLEAMLISPTRISLIILSSSLWSFLLASVQVFFYFALGKTLFKAGLGNFSLLALTIITILTIVCFSSLGIIAAGFIMVHKRGDPVIWFFSTLSGLLSGIYYPVSILPEWLKPVAFLLPNTYILEAVRKVFLQKATLGAIKGELSILLMFCLILFPLSLVAFRQSVRKAKMDGSLSHY